MRYLALLLLAGLGTSLPIGLPPNSDNKDWDHALLSRGNGVDGTRVTRVVRRGAGPLALPETSDNTNRWGRLKKERDSSIDGTRVTDVGTDGTRVTRRGEEANSVRITEFGTDGTRVTRDNDWHGGNPKVVRGMKWNLAREGVKIGRVAEQDVRNVKLKRGGPYQSHGANVEDKIWADGDGDREY